MATSQNLSDFAGMPWEAWINHLESVAHVNESEQNSHESTTRVKKLPKDDIMVYGICPEREPFSVVICEICNMLVKPQALFHHYEVKHHNNNYSSQPIDTEESSVNSDISQSLDKNLPPISKNVVMKENEEICKDDNKVVNPKFKKTFSVQDRSNSSETGVSITTRKPLNYISANRIRGTNSKHKLQKKYKQNCQILSKLKKRKNQRISFKKSIGKADMSISEGISKMNLKLPEEQVSNQRPNCEIQRDSNENIHSLSTSEMDSIKFISKPPRPLSSPAFFSCFKVGGLLYPSRHEKFLREKFQFGTCKTIMPTENIGNNSLSTNIFLPNVLKSTHSTCHRVMPIKRKLS